MEQIDSIVAQNDSSIGPEEGTTYTVRVFDENDVLKKTVNGITGVDWSWDSETEDCHFEAPKSFNSQVRIELEAVRDGYTSWQKWNHIAVRTSEPEQPVFTVPTGISDSFNCTLRYSTASIFVNCKCGDGMTSVDGIATSPVMMGVIFMRKGITFTNLRLRMELLQME